MRQRFKVAPRLVFVALLSFVIGILVLGPMVYMFEVYGRVLNSQSHMTLGWLLLLLVVVLVVMEFLEWLRFRLLRALALEVEAHYARRAYRHTQEDLASHGSRQDQPLLVKDLRQVRDGLTNPGFIALFDMPIAGFFILLLYLINPWLAALAAVALFMQIAFGLGHARYAASLLKDSANQSRVSDQALRAAVFVRPSLVAMGMGGAMTFQWKEASRRAGQQADRLQSSQAVTQSAMKVIQLVASSALLGLAAWRFLSNDLMGGAAMLIVASTLGTRVLAPASSIITNWPNLVQTRLAAQRVYDALGSQADTVSSMPLPPPKGELEFQHVFAAPPNISAAATKVVPVIKGLNLKLSPGSVLAVIGPNGAGKTAFTKLAVGLWPCLSGSVRLDGADLYGWNRERLGPHIGYLPQRVDLFQASVAANLARGAAPEANDLAALIQEFDLSFVNSLPNGLDTELIDEGASLSAGQRQRLGIARAFYGRPSLVVLDEPSSRLDEQAEASLMQLIKRRSQQGCTVVFSTHSLSMLRIADQVLLLHQGEQQHLGPAEDFLESLRSNARPGA